VRSAGPSIGQHNDEIYAVLGLTPDEMARLRGIGII
jgi:crotonobetainyl-CoA:carnitine CoA-transferase CaiB-like acyl-CoA transferase